MIMLKIVAFYTLLAAFIAASWLWHRVWFGRDIDIVTTARLSDRRDNGGEPGVAKTVPDTIRAGTVILVLAVLSGLYLVVYALLT